ncbi:MAG: deoxyguanosinetriphosphate triphosphohydrolase [Ruminococcaceae bacterium]|nr:deoxyguanosinetriphosphate triphosphohydrolase [Oscillospiraceae bacterium]
MTIREQLERQEHLRFSERAQFSDASRGRNHSEEEPEFDVRTCYQRDCDRILHSKSFRRLMHKTQVFLQPEGDHYRTRMTHTLEVSRIARTIARSLRLNEDLTEAIAFGHDLGHTPFGHAGEVALTEVMGQPFCHNEQSLRVVDILEKDGQGLNLTYEVRMGILGHTSSSRMPETLEGQIVRKSDQIAYINHDIDDAMRAEILTDRDIPREISEVLGNTHRERINTLVTNMIAHSMDGPLGMDAEVEQAMQKLRAFMFERVYKNPKAKGEEAKAREILKRLYEFYVRHPEKLPPDFQPQLSFDGMERTVCDYIAGMSDKYAMYKYDELFIPTAWQVRG